MKGDAPHYHRCDVDQDPEYPLLHVGGGQEVLAEDVADHADGIHQYCHPQETACGLLVHGTKDKINYNGTDKKQRGKQHPLLS